MRHGYLACTRTALRLVVVAAIVTGCATSPPPPAAAPTSLPQPGDTIEQIAARGYEVALLFAFASDGHEYAYLVASSVDWGDTLIQVDGKMACRRSDIALETAGEPRDGNPQDGSAQDVSAQQWFLYQFESEPESQPQSESRSQSESQPQAGSQPEPESPAQPGSQPQPQPKSPSPSTAGHWQEFTQWQWVAQPGGLRYLASQMRQACDLEPDTEPQSLPSTWTKREKVQPPPSSAATSTGGFGEAVGQAVGAAIYVPVAILAAPYVLAGSVAYLVVSSPFVAAEHSADKRQLEQRKQVHLGLTRADTVSLLGKPEAEFTLEPVQTRVLMYEAGASTQNYFVGFQDDVIVWIHAQDEWLEHLAKRARKEKN